MKVKKIRKFLAFLCSAALIISALPVLGADPITGDEPTINTVNWQIFANGTPVTIRDDGGLVNIYKDSDPSTPLFQEELESLRQSENDDSVDIGWFVIYGGWASGDHMGDTSVTIDLNNGYLYNNIYGGSAEGSITGNTNVTVNSGMLNYTIFGGSYDGTVNGNTNVTVSGGTLWYVYGGGCYGSVTGTASVSIGGSADFWNGNNGGACVYGGGLEASAEIGNTNVMIDGGNFDSVYGGGYNAPVNGDTSVYFNSGVVEYSVYGGGYCAPITGDTSVVIEGGNVEGSVYGGGQDPGATVGDTTVTIKNGVIGNNVFGGGGDTVGETNVTVEGGTIGFGVFGGGNGAGAAATNVTVVGGTIGTEVAVGVYGGSVGASVTGESIVKVSFTADIAGTVSTDGIGGTVNGEKTVAHIIASKEDMKILAEKVNTGDNLFAGETVELYGDIDLDGEAWTPIGKYVMSNNVSTSFQGVFDGKGYTISGLNVSSAGQIGAVGLFGTIYQTGAVKNLTVEGVIQATVTPIGELYMGGIVAYNDGGILQNCISNVTVTVGDGVNSGTYTHIGGLVGWNGYNRVGFDPLIENCSAHGDITVGHTGGGRAVQAGGLVGYSDGGLIKNCFATGTVTSDCNAVASNRHFGGFIGSESADGVIEDCYATGDVIGEQYTEAGGFAGNTYGLLKNCYATGKVSGSRAGGITGGYSGGRLIGCVALNPAVEKYADDAMRVGYIYPGDSADNAAFIGMVNMNGTTEWNSQNYEERNGTDLTTVEIHNDGTLGGRFTAAGGWTIENGKLPSFGTAADIPFHLQPVMVEITGITANSNLVYSQTAKGVDATEADAEAAAISGLSYTYEGVGDTDYEPSSAAPVNAGDYTCTVTLTDSMCIADPLVINFTIAPKLLLWDYSGVTVTTKDYDGTTTASIAGTPTISGVIAGDMVNIIGGALSGAYDNANAGIGKTVIITPSGYSADNDNYTLPAGLTFTKTGDINPINFTGNVTISNTEPKVGDVLIATVSETGTAGNHTYIWNGAGNPINEKTYTVTAEDVGNTLTVTVGTSNQNYIGTFASAATQAVQSGGDNPPPPPNNTPYTPPAKPTVPGNGGAVSINYTEEEGEVSLDLTEEKIDELINSAEDGMANIDVSGIEDVDSAIFDVDAAERFADAEVSVTVDLPDAEVTLDPYALAILADTTDIGTTPITVAASDVPMKDLKGLQAAQVKGYETVVNIDVYVGDEKVDVPVTVSLPYKLKANEDPNAVRVWHLDDDGKLTRLNGVYNKETGMITFTVTHQSYFVVGYDPVALWENIFRDITPNDWFYDAVAYANHYGYVDGNENMFNPFDSFSRATFVTLIWKLEGRPTPIDNGQLTMDNFADVPAGLWYTDAVYWAAEQGIVTGTGNGFNPSKLISRQEMITMLYNYLQYKGYDIPAYVEAEFDDGSSVASWAFDAVNDLANERSGECRGIEWVHRRHAEPGAKRHPRRTRAALHGLPAAGRGTVER